MTNYQIILHQSIELMKSGAISGSGKFICAEHPDGTIEQIELPEEIHTFAAWKSRGYSVKKGEHAIAAFPIWKFAASARRSDSEELINPDEQTPDGRMFMKTAYFFRACQVEPSRERRTA